MAHHQSAKKRIRQSEQRRLGNKYYTKSTRNAIKKLKRLKLIKERKQKNFPYKHLFTLTDKGKKIAKKLVEIERILGR